MKKIVSSILFLLLALNALAQEGTHYIIHSSGNVVGKASDDRAVLVSATEKNVKPLEFTKQSDGSYTIALSDKYLSLSPTSNWNTYFLDDPTTPRAHYKIETSGQYVKFKNMQTNSYLGTDDSNVGAYLYSDKNGSDTKHLWKISDTPVLEVTVDTISYPVSIDASRQLVEGWGVSLCWWANMCGKWSDQKIDQLIDYMVSPEGLNWNIFRYNIGGGDDPNWTNCYAHHMGNGKGLRAEMEGFQDERGGEYHWERDAAQRKIMLKILEKRPDAIFEAFSNSCPWWMTVSGCCAGNEDGGKDNLRTDYYEDFAHYLVDVCKHYKDEYGIEFKTLEPFNEAVTNFWYKAGVQEGCHFDFASQVAFVKVLAPILKESGLNTTISVADETNIGYAVSGLKEFQKAGVMDYIGQCNSHTYSADNRSRSQFGSLSRADGKMCWMSETGSGGSGIGGNLSLAQRLIDDVRYIAPEAWIDWQYMEENNDQWCVVKGSFSNATFQRVKNYYVRQQVTRFIKQGYTVVASLNSHSLAAVNPTRDSLVLVLLNTGVKTIHQVSLPMASITPSITAYRTSESESLKLVNSYKLLSDSILQVELPGQSITTLIIPFTTSVKPSDSLVEGDTYMIFPQSSATVAVSATTAGMSIAAADPTDPAQLWTIKEISEGVYSFQNGNNLVPTSTSGYTINLSKATSANPTKAQQFQVEKIDGINCRILVSGDSKLRGWDLSNESLNAGTQVGAWEYGNAVSADHRNWFFVRVATASEETAIENLTDATTSSETESIYSLSGIKLSKPAKGINIIRQKDGKTKKIHL